MAVELTTTTSTNDRSLPDGLYIGFVDRLFLDVVPLCVSAGTVAVVQIVAAIAARSAILACTAAIQLFIAAIRLHYFRIHQRSAPSASVEIARLKERDFTHGAFASLAAIALWTLLAFCVTENGFARFLAATSTIAYAFGMLTRSSTIYRGMNLQLVAAFVPLSAAMLVAGDWYPAAIVGLFLPLIVFMKGSSHRVRENFMAVVAAQGRATTLAGQLDTAMNNMSHGLCMVDRTGHIILANEQLLKIFAISPTDARLGADTRKILRDLVQKGVISSTEFSRIVRAILASDENEIFVVPLETKDERAIEVTIHRMHDNGSVVVVQDVTERRNAQREIDRIARTDTVTELPNRRFFEEQLAEALPANDRPCEEVTVLFLDLDDFKQVNDSLGHRLGDKLLIEVARRLKAIVGPRGLVARWGGDEFTILRRGAYSEQETGKLADRIIQDIRRPVFVDGYEVIVGVSVGSASAPADGLIPDVILSKADIALYAAKLDGRGSWRPFEKSMDAKIQIRRLIEIDLRTAVENELIEVYYQPIIDVASRKISSFEALARWNHPVKGRMSPAEFIPIIEEIGLMEAMGASVLRRACIACASWPEEVSVSVNLSSTQFRGGKIEKTILDALAFANLAPERLELEITESTLLDDRGGTRDVLASLRARGVRISLDDFGTGYSSLSYLLSFPLDRIKIDRSFTVGLGFHERASILVESVAMMSARLGMSVLIEGVETEKQLQFIERLDTIAEVQGFLFSPAVPEPEARKMLGRDLGRNVAA